MLIKCRVGATQILRVHKRTIIRPTRSAYLNALSVRLSSVRMSTDYKLSDRSSGRVKDHQTYISRNESRNIFYTKCQVRCPLNRYGQPNNMLASWFTPYEISRNA